MENVLIGIHKLNMFKIKHKKKEKSKPTVIKYQLKDTNKKTLLKKLTVYL
jgi:hypothetical protein